MLYGEREERFLARARTPEHALTKSDPLSVCSGHLVFDLAININPCDGTLAGALLPSQARSGP